MICDFWQILDEADQLISGHAQDLEAIMNRVNARRHEDGFAMVIMNNI
jgi:hypothetical protein